jgi:hypothetical protein
MLLSQAVGLQVSHRDPSPADRRRAERNPSSDIRHTVVALLTRFFREQGFTTPLARIAERLDRVLADPFCWCALREARDDLIGRNPAVGRNQEKRSTGNARKHERQCPALWPPST